MTKQEYNKLSEEYDKLTEEKKRIKVAELNGFERFDNAMNAWWHPVSRCSRTLRQLPDSLNDLNAIHEIIGSEIDDSLAAKFDEILEYILDGHYTWNAEANELAKAFALTMTEGVEVI